MTQKFYFQADSPPYVQESNKDFVTISALATEKEREKEREGRKAASFLFDFRGKPKAVNCPFTVKDLLLPLYFVSFS